MCGGGGGAENGLAMLKGGLGWGTQSFGRVLAILEGGGGGGRAQKKSTLYNGGGEMSRMGAQKVSNTLIL